MEETSLRKCESCGGRLQALDADTLKCPYCGCTYSSKRAEQSLAAGSRPPTNEVNSQANPGNSDTQANIPANNSSGARIFLFLLLFVVAVVVIALVSNASHGGNLAGSDAADSLKGDTADTTLNILSDEDKKEAHEPHIKKTNPDPEILITQHRIGMDDGTKAIFIGYRNKSKHMIDNVQFNIQLFEQKVLFCHLSHINK